MSNEKKGNYFLETIIAVFVALIISLLLVVIAAFAIKLFNISDSAIVIINQVIKGLSILLAGIFCLKLPNNGWLRGFILGLIYVLLAFVVFSLLSGEFTFDLTLLNDAVLGGVSGLISGIVAVNIRKKSE
ncbi:MAG: TIGR04086 family membrane protein [Clostridiales bacterium]|nr:TIGR04086 family membrane protein [Clostridiales bacterium]